MNELGAIVEGETEQTFVRDILAPHLGARRVSMWARLPGKIARRGGVRPWQSILEDIKRTLDERPDRYCTIMFDYYAMPLDWPGRAETPGLPPDRRAAHIETALAESVVQRMGSRFRGERFIPYVQMHEFEAVLFSDVPNLAEVLSTATPFPHGLTERLDEILRAAGEPEAIDDSPDTAPSKRIQELASGYRKLTHGIIAANRIGLAKMRAAWPHFDAWVTRLESLGTGSLLPQ